jgi:hypothetical protein
MMATLTRLPKTRSDAEPGDTDEHRSAEEDEPATQPEPVPQTGKPDQELIEAELASKPRAAPKPPRPSVMARFALAQGYKADGEDRFFHADGSWIGRGNGARFPWERRSADGGFSATTIPRTIAWSTNRSS